MNEIDLTRLDLNLLVTFEVLMDEGNVTRAAARLGRTQSAVSHALARLREQVGDPLLVKSGGRMSPSPRALTLIEEVRPILRSIQRVIAPPEPFDPESSNRIFRLAIPDISATLLCEVQKRVQKDAPNVGLEWIRPTTEAYSVIAEGQIDLALGISGNQVPEGTEFLDCQNYTFTTFARKGHPAVKNWNMKAWTQWPHIQVMIGDNAKSPVSNSGHLSEPKRTIGARITNFAHVAPLLSQTDYLATLSPLMLAEGIEQYGLRALEPPPPVKMATPRFFWSFRLSSDPGSKWIRDIVVEIFTELQNNAEQQILGRNLTKMRKDAH